MKPQTILITVVMVNNDLTYDMITYDGNLQTSDIKHYHYTRT